MIRTRVAVGAAVIAAVAMFVGCGKGSEPPAREGAPAGSAQSGTEITLKTNPDPVRTGENTFEVMVMEDGKPVTDATVSTEFYMAAMPSMNMPEMRNTVRLEHINDGRYRGTGNVSMGGRWDVTVVVTRAGKQIGSLKTAVTAK